MDVFIGFSPEGLEVWVPLDSDSPEWPYPDCPVGCNQLTCEHNS